MPLVSSAIPNLINGISQQPPTLRLATQGEVQDNGLSSVVKGLEKRPASQHLASITGISSPDSAYIHTMQRDDEEAYVAVITHGSIKVYDLLAKHTPYGQSTKSIGQSIPVYPNSTPSGTVSSTYLNVASGNTAADTFGATTVADYTFITNKTTTVTQSTSTLVHERPYEALLYVKNGDYKSKYKVVISFTASNGKVYNYEVSASTPSGIIKTTSSGSGTTTATQQNNQATISTQNICDGLTGGTVTSSQLGTIDSIVVSAKHLTTAHIQTESNWATSDSTALPADEANSFSVTYTADTNFIYVKSIAKNFKVEVSDGHGGEDFEAIVGHKEVSSFGRLPSNLPKHLIDGYSSGTVGFTASVTGDNQKAQDDYYVYWNGDAWKETVKPKYPSESADTTHRVAFNSSTMPHQLRKAFHSDGKVFFIFEEAPWLNRKVGDTTTNPFPSFVDFTINDVFFHRNRLGFLSDENVIFSEAGSYFNFFSITTLTILDNEPIDVAVSNNQVSLLKYAVPFNEALIIFSDLQQFKLSAQDILTPTSVSIDVTTQFEASTKTPPVPAGRYVFFPFVRGDYSGVREYFVDIQSETSDAQEVTTHVPQYIEGDVVKMIGSSNEDMLAVLGETNKKHLYIYKYYWAGEEKLQSSWSRWVFDADILNMGFIGSDIILLFNRSGTLYLEKITLSTDPSTLVMDDNIPVLLDRRVKLTSSSSSLPYSDATGVQYISSNGRIVASTDVATEVGAGRSVYAGIPYTFKYRVSEQIHKNNNVAVNASRLQLRNMTLSYNNTGFFKVEVTPDKRTTRTNTFSGVVVGSTVLHQQDLLSGTYRFPILAKSDKVQIEVKNDKHLPCVLQSGEWEGMLVVRSDRV